MKQCPFYKSECIQNDCYAYNDKPRYIQTESTTPQGWKSYCPGLSLYAYCEAFRTELPFKINFTCGCEE